MVNDRREVQDVLRRRRPDMLVKNLEDEARCRSPMLLTWDAAAVEVNC